MNNIMSISNPEALTMSSREIAELTVKRHDHVLRDIRSMLMSLYGDEAVKEGIPEKDLAEKFFEFLGMGIDSPKLGNKRIQGLAVTRDSRGFVSEISLDYSHTMTLISGYNVKLRKGVIDRWQSLESTASNPIANLSRKDLLKLALETEEENEQLRLEVKELAPKARALDLISAQKDSMTLTQAAKTCGMKVKEFIALLHAYGWVYRQNGSWVAYDKYIKNGCLEYKEAVYTDEKTGLECRKSYCHVTPKGLVKLAEMFSIDLEPA